MCEALTECPSFANENGGGIVTFRGWLGLGLLVLVVVCAGLAWIRAEGTAPTIQGPDAVKVGGDGREVEVSLTDAGTGLREVRAVVKHAAGESILLEERFAGDLLRGGGPAGAAHTLRLKIDPKALDLPEGSAFLQIAASDWSWRNGLGGNQGELVIPIEVDRKKPRIHVLTGLTYVTRGGAGAVSYTISEASVRDGVAVGDTFYRGYPHPDDADRRIAIYAVPTDAPAKPTIQVVAEDAAGNVGHGRWSVVVKDRVLPEASVTLPESFLELTVRDLAEASGIDTADLRTAFARINTELRKANEEQIRRATAATATTPLWQGSFEQLSNSQVTSRFAEQRTYFVGGQKNSEAVHFGYDLASTSSAPITAANAGRVVHADDLGIYGNCVLVDHGIGVATLYGHLSRIDVAVGDEIAKGEILGLSGATGLAGGDHLHFAILVGVTYVDPLEWWDPTWVRTHIDTRLSASGQ